MKILHLLRSDSFAGVERYLTYTAPELARRGHSVTVVGGDPRRMRPVLAPAGVVHAEARRVGDVATAAVRAGRPDLVHAHMTAAELAALVTWPVLRRPIVTTRHFAARRGHNRAGRLAYSPIPHLVRREIAISGFVAARAGSPCVVIPNGVPTPPRTGHDRRPIVLVAQRLEREKDTATALRAWAASGLGARGWCLHVAGRGREEPALRALADHAGVSASVRFLGHLPDLWAELASAGLFLATAPAEPFGLGVVEAMAAATPTVVAAGGAHLETAGAVEEAAVFPPGDAEACGRELRRLADDPDGRDALGRRLQARYEAEYTIERHVDRLERLYDEVLSDGETGRGR